MNQTTRTLLRSCFGTFKGPNIPPGPLNEGRSGRVVISLDGSWRLLHSWKSPHATASFRLRGTLFTFARPPPTRLANRQDNESDRAAARRDLMNRRRTGLPATERDR